MADRQNAVLIVLDTLRKDYADQYIWPILKKGRFIKYDNAIAAAPWTTPSHVSMLTGMYPFHHDVHLTKEIQSPKDVFAKKARPQMVQEKISAHTALISANILVSNYYGYGFREYFDATTIQEIPDKARLLTKKDMEELKKSRVHYGNKIKEFLHLLKTKKYGVAYRAAMTKLLYALIAAEFKIEHPEWPKDMGGKKILKYMENRDYVDNEFLVINFMEPHEPYTVFEVSTKAWKKNYGKHVNYLAGILRRALKTIRNSYSDPKIIVVSDHGQLLGENNLYGHGYYPHEILVHVPLYANFNLRQTGKWYSTKHIHDEILRMYEEDVPAAKEESVLSEYFGIYPHDEQLVPKYRIAVYYKDYKGIFNVDDWKWESWKTYNEEEEVPREAKKEMMKIVLRHLKGALAAKEAKRKITRSGV